jgi:hypothetical protein
MKKLVAAIVLVGTLSMANGAMAYGNGHNQPRDEKKYVEHRGKDSNDSKFGARVTSPQPRPKLQPKPQPKPNKNHRERERSKWESHRHQRYGLRFHNR